AVAQPVRIPVQAESALPLEHRELVLGDGDVLLPRTGRSSDHALREAHPHLIREVRTGLVDDRVLAGPTRADDRDERAGHATRTPSRHTPRTTGTGAPDGWCATAGMSCTCTRTMSARRPTSSTPRSSRPMALAGL